ncbi:PE-PGRS family protein [Streptomyces olivoreticuli]
MRDNQIKKISGQLASRDPDIQSITPGEVKEILVKRLTQGPTFSDEEVLIIRRLSWVAPDWLNEVGIGRYEEARNYTNRKEYRNWLQLEPGRRLLRATLEWNNYQRAQNKELADAPAEPPNTPAYTLGRSLMIQGGSLSGEQLKKATVERDKQILQAFVKTLQQPDLARPEATQYAAENSQARAILTRIFLILQNGLKVYQKTGRHHVDFKEGDVARALAHGGRVNIRIPQLRDESPYALTDWLGMTRQGEPQGPVRRRSFGTHHMQIGKNPGGVAGTGKFKEMGGAMASIRNKFTKGVNLYGLDLAASGLGNLDFNGDVILPDGGHGHMFIGFTPPGRNRDGALQVGIETTSPGGHSPVGYVHNWRSSEATANPESSVHGHKSEKIGEGKLATSQRLVNLGEFGTEGRWLPFLDELETLWYHKLAATEGNPDELRKLYEKLAGPRQGKFQP